jgi:hypothetical protein
MVLSVQRQERWAFRSMHWIRKDIEAEQIPVQSSDLTAAVLRLLGRSILAVSVYVEGQDCNWPSHTNQGINRWVPKESILN